MPVSQPLSPHRRSVRLWRVLLAGWAAACLAASTISGSPQQNPVEIVVSAIVPTSGRTTLAEALTQAAADSQDNRIVFAAGMAQGNSETHFVLDASWQSGSRSGSDTLDGSALPHGCVLDVSKCQDAGVVVGGGQVHIKGVQIVGGNQRAILVRHYGRLELEQVAITSSQGPGIALFNGASLSTKRCQINRNATHGLELHGNSTARLTSTEFVGNGQSAAGVFNQGRLTATACTMRDNGQWNLVIAGTGRAELSNCSLSGANFANIDASESAGLDMDSCTVADGKRFGLFATGTSSSTIRQSFFRGHRNRGIELQDTARLAMNAGAIESSGDYGLILFGKSECRVEGSAVVGNGAHGVSLRDSASGHFTRCSFRRNRYSGIGCLDAADGGAMRLEQCTFTGNAMRPVYRGPMHLDPLPPTPVRIREQVVECLAGPEAEVELYLDPVGEAAQYLRTVRADQAGRFRVSCQNIPGGSVITATATVGKNTSEMNVIAGAASLPIMAALLGKTGPYSDGGGEVQSAALLRRWPSGSHLRFQLTAAPSRAVERYCRFAVQNVPDWTAGAITASLSVGSPPQQSPPGSQVIPVEYFDGNSPHLLGRGGVTLMRWDARGAFQNPMQIMVATASEPLQTCPRVLMHEIGHTLGLCHARVGLLSRMQGMTPPVGRYINDFSPILTYYDVLALQMLHTGTFDRTIRLGELAERGLLPPIGGTLLAAIPIANQPQSQSEQPAAPLPRPTINP